MVLFSAEFGLLTASALWGITCPFIRASMTAGTSMFAFVGIRHLLAALLTSPFAFRTLWRDRRALVLPSLGLGLLTGSVYWMQTIGMKTTTAAKSGFIHGTNVVIVPFLDAAVRHSTPDAFVMVGALITVAGLYIMAGFGTAAPGLAGNLVVGDYWTLCCAFTHALHLVLIQPYLHKFGHWSFLHAQLVVVAVSSLAVGPFIEEWQMDWNNWEVIGSIFYCGVFASGVAGFIHFRNQAKTSPASAALILAMEPVFSALSAALVLSERPDSSVLTGCVVILVGVLVSQAGPHYWASFRKSGAQDHGAWAADYHHGVLAQAPHAA